MRWLGFLLAVTWVAATNGAAILPFSQQVFHEENITDALTGETRRAPGNGGMDLETFTKNAAIRTNQENAILQQLAFRRNNMLTTRDAPTFNNTLATQVADSDLMNALLHPSSAGHSSQSFGFQGIGGLPPWEKDRLLLELMEQNRRQQLEIQRLVQQNMMRQGRPVMPFMEEDDNRINPNLQPSQQQQFGQQLPIIDLSKQRSDLINAQQQNGMLRGNGRGGDNAEQLAILNSIRTVTSRAANGLDQFSPQQSLSSNDFEFLRRQINPFEAPQRQPHFPSPRGIPSQQQQQQQGFFREDVTDAFGRRLPVQLKDFTTMNGVSAVSGEAYVTTSSTTSEPEREYHNATPPIPAPPSLEVFNNNETKKTA